MKNIKSFKQLFEGVENQDLPKVAAFESGQYDKFILYRDLNGLSDWLPIKNKAIYQAYTKKYGSLYMIEDKFLVMCSGDSEYDIQIIEGLDIDKNNYYSIGEEITEKVLNALPCSIENLKKALFIAKTTGSSGDNDYLYTHFKKNPMDLYKLNHLPDLKKDILDRTGMRDYSKIANGLNNGLI